MGQTSIQWAGKTWNPIKAELSKALDRHFPLMPVPADQTLADFKRQERESL